jgi:hypothetical protein
MTAKHLSEALNAVDWNKNAATFLSNSGLVNRLAACNLTLALWARQLEDSDKGNPALSFIREMQAAGHNVASVTALGLYKPAASAIRTVFESALYYTYFRTHPVELATLLRDSAFYVSKKDVIEFHKTHTPRFQEVQAQFGLSSRVQTWYSDVSATIHGQIPGKWHHATSLQATKHDSTMLNEVIVCFEECEFIVGKLFLCTVAQELWDDFSPSSKPKLLKGIAADKKASLGLDLA